MRIAAIMHRPVILVLTHDSIGLGEVFVDGRIIVGTLADSRLLAEPFEGFGIRAFGYQDDGFGHEMIRRAALACFK